MTNDQSGSCYDGSSGHLHSLKANGILYARSAVFDIGKWARDAALFGICASRALDLVRGGGPVLSNATVRRQQSRGRLSTRTVPTIDPTKGWGSAFTMKIEADD